MKRSIQYLLLFFVVFAQTNVSFAQDQQEGKEKKKEKIEVVDSLDLKPTKIKIKEKKPHSPHKATILAMCLPGAGQIYNDQWWKVPILYGGFAGTIYAASFNANNFKKYRDSFAAYSAYVDAKAANPDLPVPEDPAWDKVAGHLDWEDFDSGEEQWLLAQLENKKDSFKRNRDLSYIIMGAIYALNIIDATVFAHFYDFEIDDDLSLNIAPTSSFTPDGANVGIALTLRF